MKDFGRAFRIATRYRWTVMGIMASSLAVAVFWGANLGTIYPIVDIVLKGRSLQQWVDENVALAQTNSAELQAEIKALEAKVLASPQAKEASVKLASVRRRYEAEQESLHGTWIMPGSLALQPWIHEHMPQEPYPTLMLVVAALLIGTLLKATCLIFNVVLVHRISQLVAFDLRKQLYRSTVALELARFKEEGTSRMLSHFTHDMQEVAKGLNTVFGRAIREPLKIVVCLTGAVFICWRLLLLSLIISPVAVYLINRLAKSVKRASHRAMTGMADLFEVLEESLTGITLVKAFTSERSERRRIHLTSKEYMRKAMKVAIYNSFNRPLTEFMGMCTVAVAILTGGYLVLNQETHLGFLQMSERPLNFGALMTFFALLAGISDPFRKLSDVYSEVQRGAAAAERVFGRIDIRPKLVDPPQPAELLLPLEDLTLDSVHFSYQEGCEVLHDVSIRLAAGRTLAIVGPNGCGKSSLLNLLPRFYDPTAGSVCWNGVDLRAFRRRDIRRQIGVVTQQAMLFDETVADNIRYGCPGATDEQVKAAATKAHAHQFITRELSDGYETRVGQGGKRLSGGQRQRIALARAILRDPAILLLDEATSQVDVASEHLIRQTLSEFSRDRTTIMITHRLETLSLADEILVMDSGQVVDTGTHEELLSRCSLYQHLHQVQFKVPA
jgi:ATP-binding cassette subfamily B protein/subfamily B ATP-binding cassette protein MsbA